MRLGHGLGQRCVGRNFQCFLLKIAQTVIENRRSHTCRRSQQPGADPADSSASALSGNQTQSQASGSTIQPASIVPFFQSRQDVTTAHCNGWNADFCVSCTNHARRRAEAHLAEVIHGFDWLWEPTKGLWTNWLQHEAFDVHAHFVPQTVVQLFAATELEPG